MATIEIDINEFNSYKDDIRRLHKEKFDLREQIKERDSKIENLTENIEIIKSVNLYDRIFGWKQILKLIST